MIKKYLDDFVELLDDRSVGVQLEDVLFFVVLDLGAH